MAARDRTSPAGEDRRGRPLPYVSYWSTRERTRRAQIFRLHERGLKAAEIAAELRLAEADVVAVLRTDRRERQRADGPR